MAHGRAPHPEYLVKDAQRWYRAVLLYEFNIKRFRSKKNKFFFLFEIAFRNERRRSLSHAYSYDLDLNRNLLKLGKLSCFRKTSSSPSSVYIYFTLVSMWYSNFRLVACTHMHVLNKWMMMRFVDNLKQNQTAAAVAAYHKMESSAPPGSHVACDVRPGDTFYLADWFFIGLLLRIDCGSIAGYSGIVPIMFIKLFIVSAPCGVWVWRGKILCNFISKQIKIVNLLLNRKINFCNIYLFKALVNY